MYALNSPWKDYTFVAFDTETTGKYPLVAEVCEIAAVKWQGGKVVGTFESLVKPCHPIGEDVIRIHGITNEMVAQSPPLKDVLVLFDEFIRGSVLLAHNAPFDLGFLAPEYEAFGLPLPQEIVLDSCLLSLAAFPNSTNHRLITLINYLNLPSGKSHRALDDSHGCLGVSLKAMQALGENATLEFIANHQPGGPLRWENYSIKSFATHEIFGPLVEGSLKKLVVEICYQGGRKPGIPRRITPQGIVKNPKGDYVVGFCHVDLRDKRFFLNKVTSAKILD